MLEDEPELRLGHRQALAGADEERDARPAPVLDLQPQRGEGLRRRVGRDAGDRAVALVLPPHVVRRVGLLDRAEERELGGLDRLRVAARRRLHRAQGDDLHQVVDDDVAQRPDRIVEVTAVLDAEGLRHRDLDVREVVAVPDRLEHRVREPQADDLLGAHLPQVVVDPEDLRLVDVAVHLGGERPRGREVVAERLLDDDAGRPRQPRLRQPLHDPAEQERRDLEVEDRQLRVPERVADPLVGGVVVEVPRDVGEARREAPEDVLVELLAGADDRLARARDELVDRPVVGRHAEDGAIEQAAALEPVERAEGHHLRQVARDPEYREPVRRLAFAWQGPGLRGGGGGRVSGHSFPLHRVAARPRRSGGRR